jgi:anti-sigma factor RsiW
MTAKHSPLTELMHAVLDGEASAAEARELELRLVADPAARAEFDDWQRLFHALGEVAQEHAPEGLVASVTAALPSPPRTAGDRGQPFPDRRVLGHMRFGFPRRVLGESRAMQPSRVAPSTPTRSVTMTQQSRIFAHRKAWLGAGIAAAAAVVVAQVAFDFPVAKDVIGTVAPAERYRAAPNGSEDVKLGVPAGSTANSTATNEASRSVAEKSAELTAQQKADLTAQQRADLTPEADLTEKADLTAQKTADLTAQKTVDLTAQKTADLTAQKKADLTAQKTADLTAQQRADLTAQKKADLTAQKTADLTAQKTADLNAQKAADMAMQRSEAARAQTQRSMEMSTNRTAP